MLGFWSIYPENKGQARLGQRRNGQHELEITEQTGPKLMMLEFEISDPCRMLDSYRRGYREREIGIDVARALMADPTSSGSNMLSESPPYS